ncbi:MAG TPA: hypothetical protein VEN81_15290 [Planctomycetota bacterium]|nr:hypothetical protein [Planctomycetota bacterium]
MISPAMLLFVLAVQDAPASGIRFLDTREAARGIADDSGDPYFSLLQPLEMIAKTGAPLTQTGLAAQREECRQRYRDSVREFTADEKAALGAAAGEIREALKKAYPIFAETPWSFLKTDGSIEGGLPHTRGPHIVFSDRTIRQFALLRGRGVNPAKTGLGQLLIHEQCHVVQRARPRLFEDLFTRVWGFIRAEGLPGGPWQDKVQIVNPDGPDVGWVFVAKEGASTEYWQPLVALKEGVDRPKMPKDFVLIGIALDRKGTRFIPRTGADGRPEIRALDKIPAWQAAWGQVDENFHPNETFAVLFSWLAMKDHVAETGPGLESHAAVDFTSLRDWCRKNFAKN